MKKKIRKLFFKKVDTFQLQTACYFNKKKCGFLNKRSSGVKFLVDYIKMKNSINNKLNDKESLICLSLIIPHLRYRGSAKILFESKMCISHIRTLKCDRYVPTLYFTQMKCTVFVRD